MLRARVTVIGVLIVILSAYSAMARAQVAAADHEHDHGVRDLLAESRILPPLGHDGRNLQIVEVEATEEGFRPSTIAVRRGEPIVLVSSNTSDHEHHFHIMGLEPAELSWFMTTTHDLEDYDTGALFAVERADDHICSSVTGICRLGINVHLHADPHSFDAVVFTAPASGSFEIACPLHPELVAAFVVE